MRARRAFSLVELIAAMSTTVILLGGAVGAITLVTRAAPGANATTRHVIDAATLAERIAAELETATAIVAASPTGIEFEIERLGTTHTVAYQWTGDPGAPAPVTRSVDGAAPVVMLESVRQFMLDYTVWSETGDAEPPVIESGEVELYRIDASNTLDQKELSVRGAKLRGQRFIPIVPLDVTSYSITRVGFFGRIEDLPTETVRVAIHQTVKGLPETKAVASALFPESALVTGQWSFVSFPGGLYFDIRDEIAIVFSPLLGGSAAYITAGSTVSEMGALLDGETGKVWSVSVADGLWLQVYGTIVRPDPNWTPPADQRLVAVHIEIDSTADGAGLVATSATLLNEPDVSDGEISP